VQEIERLLLVV